MPNLYTHGLLISCNETQKMSKVKNMCRDGLQIGAEACIIHVKFKDTKR